MFQAAFWGVTKTKLMTSMPDCCKQLCIWCKKELLYFYWGRETFSPSENRLTALWGTNWVFGSLKCSLKFPASDLYKAAQKP